jgi:hypothetical protein
VSADWSRSADARAVVDEPDLGAVRAEQQRERVVRAGRPRAGLRAQFHGRVESAGREGQRASVQLRPARVEIERAGAVLARARQGGGSRAPQRREIRRRRRGQREQTARREERRDVAQRSIERVIAEAEREIGACAESREHDAEGADHRLHARRGVGGREFRRQRHRQRGVTVLGRGRRGPRQRERLQGRQPPRRGALAPRAARVEGGQACARRFIGPAQPLADGDAEQGLRRGWGELRAGQRTELRAAQRARAGGDGQAALVGVEQRAGRTVVLARLRAHHGERGALVAEFRRSERIRVASEVERAHQRVEFGGRPRPIEHPGSRGSVGAAEVAAQAQVLGRAADVAGREAVHQFAEAFEAGFEAARVQ